MPPKKPDHPPGGNSVPLTGCAQIDVARVLSPGAAQPNRREMPAGRSHRDADIGTPRARRSARLRASGPPLRVGLRVVGAPPLKHSRGAMVRIA